MSDLHDPYAAPGASPDPGTDASLSATLLQKLASNMRFVGTVNVVYGALVCLSLIGALIGVPMLIGGLRLREGADALDRFRAGGHFGEIELALAKQERYFYIQKVLLIVGLVIGALYFIAIFAFIGTVGLAGMRGAAG